MSLIEICGIHSGIFYIIVNFKYTQPLKKANFVEAVSLSKKLVLASGMALILLNLAILAQGQGYTTYYDPNGLFSMAVPSGWSTQGQSYVDAHGIGCWYLLTTSPDYKIRIQLGDKRLQATFSNALSGLDIAKYYYQTYVANSIKGVKVIKSAEDKGDSSGTVAYTTNDGSAIGVIYAQTAPYKNGYGIKLFFHVFAATSELSQALNICGHMLQSRVSTSA